MKTDPVTVTPSLSVAQLVDDYIYKYHYKMFPIVEDTDRLVGCVTTKQVKEIPREEWGPAKSRGNCGPMFFRKYHRSSCRRHEGPVDYE